MKIKKIPVLKLSLKVIVSVMLILYLFFAPTTIFKTLRQNQNLSSKQIELEYEGVLELWNIDTFEGGSVSRTRFLEKQAQKFESIYKGIFILVKNITVEQLQLNLQNNNKPDLVSFGIGAGAQLITSLIPLQATYNVRNDLIKSGNLNNIQYSIPYILGGYLLINDTEYQNNVITNLGFGGNEYHNTLVSVLYNQFKINSVYQFSQNQDSFTAYDRYLEKNFQCLLGTQRDLYRVLNRINNGSINNRNFTFLSGFTDLMQHIGICTTNFDKQQICQKFIQHLLSLDVQKQLANINMFSVLDTSIYSSGEFSLMEKSLLKSLKTFSVFLSNTELLNIKQLCKKALTSNANFIKEINKYWV